MVLIDYEARDAVSCTKDDFNTKRKDSESESELIPERRRKVEDLCRDLMVNNDHIHIIERRLRAAISSGLDRLGWIFLLFLRIIKPLLSY